MSQPNPPNYPRVMPYLTVEDGEGAIGFYTDILGGTERMRMPSPTGGIGHAEVAFGEAVVMLAEKDPMVGNQAPGDLGGTPVSITLYVDDVDAVVANAVAHGAKVVRDIEDQFYGARSGAIEDPFGHIWGLMSHMEDVGPEEMETRMNAALAG